MIVMSNHVKTLGMEIPKDVIVRINIAWIKDKDQLHKVLKENINNKIYLDFPVARTKFPKSVLTLIEAIEFCKIYVNQIEYFSFSNAEDFNIVGLIRSAVPEHIKLVPKIETYKGVCWLEHIVNAAKTDIVMCDREDLFTDLQADHKQLESVCIDLKTKCEKLNVKILNLKGVIFSDHD